jgi:NarL family two-component system response regulator LiaR
MSMSDQTKASVIRLFIVDDHAIVRDGIRALLATGTGIDVVGEADNGHDAVFGAKSLQPDVILMDLVMPKMDGIEAIRQIIAQQPEARILVLTSFAADDKLFPAIKAGAMGYLLKDSESDDLIQAIHQVNRGESSLHPKIARRVLQEMSSPAKQSPSAKATSAAAVKKPHDSQVDPLTERELEVLQLVARGQNNQEIAQQLVIAEGTVRAHMSNILSKLHLASRTQATLYALRQGLASLDESEE